MAKAIPSPFIGGLRGKVGNAVFRQGPHGLIVQKLPAETGPSTPGQFEAQRRMRLAADAWARLTPEEARAWGAAARAAAPEREARGHAALTGQQYFNQLATKRLQLFPGQPVPVRPPAGVYLGEAAAVTATAAMSGIRFEAIQPVSPVSRVELLVQRLRRASNAPKRTGYRTVAFASMGPGEPALVVPQPPGAYAVACRFVEAASGRASVRVDLGVVVVS